MVEKSCDEELRSIMIEMIEALEKRIDEIMDMNEYPSYECLKVRNALFNAANTIRECNDFLYKFYMLDKENERLHLLINNLIEHGSAD